MLITGAGVEYRYILEKTGNGYAAYAPDLPGCIAAGDTWAETEKLIREGIIIYLDALAESGAPLPEPLVVTPEMAAAPVAAGRLSVDRAARV